MGGECSLEVTILIDAMLFDFDYTLADASGGIVAGFDYACDALGLPRLKADAVRSGIGGTLSQIYDAAGGGRPIDFDAFARLYREGALPHIVECTRFFPDVLDCFCRLRARHVKIGIVSNKESAHITQSLKRDQLSQYVGVVVGRREMPAPKPDPRGVFLACEALGVMPENTVLVGDSLYDAKTAQNANLRFAAVLTGYAVREDFAIYPAAWIAENLTCLLNVINF